MNFFNSIFSDDPQPSNSPKSPLNDTESDNPNAENPNTIPESSVVEDPDSTWSFGSLIKTITTKSESAIGNYRRDFEEFGSGLLKETALIRDVASRAVQELPDSIDAGAAVAQESLESVGQAIDNLGSSVWQGTSQILELQLFDDGDVVDNDDYGNIGIRSNDRSLSLKKYSWFDSRMREIQSDPRTYNEDPDDLDDFKKWKSGFVFDERSEEIEKLMAEERAVERIYLELVPVTVDKESFWIRYFYKVDKVKQAEEARARIVRRAVSGDHDDEELSWDVDDDDDNVAKDMPEVEKTEVGRVSDVSETNVDAEEEGKCNEGKVSGEKNNDSYDSCKDSDISIVSTQPSLLPGEEELGWDEIEDVGSDDGNNKMTASGDSSVSDLRKRLSTADEEEDLSWDIEDGDDDDEEGIKS